MPKPKRTPLHDAARMLRIAANRLERVGWDEANDVLKTTHTIQHHRTLMAEAQANIDAALARMAPYQG